MCPAACRAAATPLMQYVAGVSGDQTGAAQLPQQKIARLTALVSEVDVDAPAAAGAIVALGDSITDGAPRPPTPSAAGPTGWPSGWRPAASGASSIPASAATACCAMAPALSALARLDNDVLSVPGIKYIVILEGINDIGRGFTLTGAQDPVSLEALIDADRQIIRRAHDHGIKVIGATADALPGRQRARR